MLASEIMTENPRTVRATDSVGEAIDALQAMDVRHLPVVGEADELVGMISDRDLRPLTAPIEGQFDPLLRTRYRVVDLMSSNVVSVDPDADIRDVVELMLDHRIGAVPVVDAEGAVSGIVSYVDVLRAMYAEDSDIRSPRRRRGSAEL